VKVGRADPPIDPYRPEVAKDACQTVLSQKTKPEDRVVFNITGGTKLMALGAYRAAREADPPYPVIYVETGEGQLMKVCENVTEPIPFNKLALEDINVERYLQAYGVTILRLSPSLPEAKWLSAAQTLVTDLAGPALMTAIRSEPQPSKGQNKRLRFIRSRLPDDQGKLLERLQAEHSLFTEWDMGNGSLQLKISAPDTPFFWDGDWLELYTFYAVSEATDEVGQRLYRDPRWDIQIDWQGRGRDEDVNNQVDVAAVSGARLALFECKSGKNDPDSDTVYQLEVVGRAAGLYVDKWLITTRAGLTDPNADPSQRRLVRRALMADIVPIGAEELSDLPSYLCDREAYHSFLKRRFDL
jgi:hypothetical protein